MKKTLSLVLILTLVITLFASFGSIDTFAKRAKTKLSDKKIELSVGETIKVKLKNPAKKVKWTIANKKVANIIKKSGKKNQIIKVRGVKVGKTKIIAKTNGKKYTLKVMVSNMPIINLEDMPEVIPTTAAETTVVDVETTTQSDVETTTTVTETTTEKSSEGETTTEETTTATPGNFIVDLDKYALTAQEGLALNYYFDGESDLILTEDYIADELEVYEDGQWVSVPYLDSYYNEIAGMPGIYYGNPFEKGVNLISTYGLLPVGHYRYIATVGTHYTNTSTQEFPSETYIEFDIVPDENGLNIVAEPVSKEIMAGEDLEIQFTVIANENNRTISYVENSEFIEKFDSGFLWWGTYLSENPSTEPVERTLSSMGSSTVTVPISEYFGELSPGHYRYECEVAGLTIPVEFDIVS